MFRAARKIRQLPLWLESLEARDIPSTTPVWAGYAHDPQHTDISTVASQSLERIRWSTPVDLTPTYTSSGSLLIHYGSPLVTANNTVLVPVKTSTTPNFRIEAHNGATGQLMWQVTTDYTTPASSWTPSFSPVLTPQGRLYFPGAGGTVYYIDNPDSATTPTVEQLAFFGLDVYAADASTYNSVVKVSTPITADSAGNIFFGFVATAATTANLKSGLARINAAGEGSWAAASTMANDQGIIAVALNCAPALSHDEQTLYVGVNSTSSGGSGYLLAVNSTTLAQTGRVAVKDPKSGNNATIPNVATASPVIGPDGDVYYGVLENPFPSNNLRGWLLHFSGDLTQTKTPGAFGWDDTPSIVPVSMVPSYHGTSTYLLMVKYNNYLGIGTGDGQNMIAILDPNNQTQVDPVTGATVMNPVLSILGPTQDGAGPGVREWCINAAAVDPATGCVLVNSEDGTLYRWDLSTNTFTQHVLLAPPTGEAYTPTIIGGDGTVYAINNATLWAVGAVPSLSVAPTEVSQSSTENVTAIFTVTLAHPDSNQVTVTYATVDGSALAGRDYVQKTGTVVFAPGQSTQTVSVSVLPASTYSPPLTFGLKLTNPVNAGLQNTSADATIINPITPPTISINNVSAVDGQDGTTPFAFHVTLSAPSTQTITVQFATADGSALAPADFAATEGTLTFAPGQISQDVVVNIVAKAGSQPVKTFTINLTNPVNATLEAAQATGTILNDQGSLSISDVTATVSASGPSNFVFTVSLADPVSLPVTVQVTTADGTAVAGVDYQALAQTLLTFTPGLTSQQVTVVVNGNANPAPSRAFSVNLSNPTNSALADAQGAGTINNQNHVSTIAFTSSTFSATEVQDRAAISISRTGNLSQTVTVNFSAGSEGSSPPTQYVPVSETITFNPGEAIKSVFVTLINDQRPGPAQIVALRLRDPSAGGTLGSIFNAVLTIRDMNSSPSQRFVFHLYDSLFHRVAEDGGLAYWTSLLNRGFARSQVVQALVGSDEYSSARVTSLYELLLHRGAASDESTEGTTILNSIRDIRTPTAEEQLSASILGTTEYFQSRGAGTNAGFLSALYQDLLHRSVDSGGAEFFGSALTNGSSREQVALAVLTSREADQVLVRSYFNSILNRPGDDGGVSYFTGLLQGGIPEASVVAAMLASDEYYLLSQ